MAETKSNENDTKECVFIRTIVKQDVHDRLKEFALRYSTGRGNWDFGIAIQILLDWYESSQLSSVNDKLDLLLNGLEQPKEEPKQEEDKYEELLGGHREKI